MARCLNCHRAASDALWPLYTASCLGCTARDLAQGIDFWWSERAHYLTPEYKRLLQNTWGGNPEEYATGHARVKHAAERLARMAP